MNILRYKQKAQGWMPRDDGSNDSGTPTTTTPSESTDNTRTWSDTQGSVTTNPDTGEISWTGGNGVTAGSYTDPNFNTPTQAPAVGDNLSNLAPGLSTLFSNPAVPSQLSSSLNQLSNMNYGGYTTGSDLNAQNPEQAAADQARYQDPNTPSWAARMGIIPGMSKEAYFNQLSPSANAERMGMINTGLGAVGSAFMNAVMPAPIRMGLGLARAYSGYQQNGNMQQAIGQGLSAMPGYFGAAGQALQGNYGSALAGGLVKGGVNPTNAMAAGLGTDAAMGKDISKPAAGLAGYFAGNQLGGPVGGVFGQQLGKSLASIFGKK